MKTTYFVLIVFLLSIVSCSKDKSDPKPDLTLEVVGTYTGYSYTFEQNNPFAQAQDTIACQFKVSKLDNRSVYIEFTSGLNTPKLTAYLNLSDSDETPIRLIVGNTQVGSTIIAGGSYKGLSPTDGGYSKNKQELSMALVKIVDSRLYLVHVMGKKV